MLQRFFDEEGCAVAYTAILLLPDCERPPAQVSRSPSTTPSRSIMRPWIPAPVSRADGGGLDDGQGRCLYLTPWLLLRCRQGESSCCSATTSTSRFCRRPRPRLADGHNSIPLLRLTASPTCSCPVRSIPQVSGSRSMLSLSVTPVAGRRSSPCRRNGREARRRDGGCLPRLLLLAVHPQLLQALFWRPPHRDAASGHLSELPGCWQPCLRPLAAQEASAGIC